MAMKKILYMIALVWMAFCVASCEKEVKDYDGQEGVYFYVQYGAAHGDTTIWASHSSTRWHLRMFRVIITMLNCG